MGVYLRRPENVGTLRPHPLGWGVGSPRRNTSIPHTCYLGIWSFTVKRHEGNYGDPQEDVHSRLTSQVHLNRNLNMTSYLWSALTMCLSHAVSKINGDFSRKLERKISPHVFSAPLRGFPLKSCNCGRAEKLEWCQYQIAKKCDDMSLPGLDYST